ncbi:hypothetical protein Ahy_A10g049506 [Arachis hypogaea]|uniref:K-box domain-containing protein n=1 Tax=Arachis hypogaea TaxID=3818 RepID=A0A445B7A3_ARAHY|nr:hypothetical protein Ahy_A10g049506 [Arachis hypogaea]
MDLLRHALFRSSSSAATASAAIVRFFYHMLVSAVKCGRIQVDGERVPVSYIVKSSQKISHFVHRHELPVMACEVPILQKELDVLTVCKPASVPICHVSKDYFSVQRQLFCCFTTSAYIISVLLDTSWYQEVSKLKAKYESLQRTQRHLLGEDLGPLSIKELQNLEKQLEGSLAQARQRKASCTGYFLC